MSLTPSSSDSAGRDAANKTTPGTLYNSFPWARYPGYAPSDSGRFKRFGATWTYGYDVQDSKGQRKWICRLCIEKKKLYPATFADKGTNNQKRHLLHDHRVKDEALGHDPDVKRAKRSIATAFGLNTSDPREQAIAVKMAKRVDMDAVRRAQIRYITRANKPFNTFENADLQQCFKELQPTQCFWDAFLTGKTVAASIQATRVANEGIVTEILAAAPGRIHLTFDGWTAPNGIPILGVHAHFFDAGDVLRKPLLALKQLRGRHTGENVANVVLDVLSHFNIQEKIGYCVLDNAQANDAAVESLAKELGFSAEERRLRCVGHILNLAVRVMFSGEDPEVLLSDSKNFVDAYLDGDKKAILRRRAEELRTQRKSDTLTRLHNVIRAINASHRLCESLEYHQKALDLPKLLSLVLDNETRWNSKFYMISRAMTLEVPIRRVISDALRDGINVEHFNANELTDGDWETLRAYSNVLKPFETCATKLQGDAIGSEPSGCLFSVLPAFEWLMAKLEQFINGKKELPDNSPLSESFRILITLAWKHLNKYYTLLDRSPAYCAATALHPAFTWHWFDSKWGNGGAEGENWIQRSRKSVKTLWEREYKVDPSEEASAAVSPPRRDYESVDSDDFESFAELFRPFQRRPPEADEYTKWLRLQDLPMSEKTDPVAYWKRMPPSRLKRMAMDHLAIPAMSSETERAFSSGGQMVTDYRNRLEALSIESSQLLRSWANEGLITL
jgi:hypothetical protein